MSFNSKVVIVLFLSWTICAVSSSVELETPAKNNNGRGAVSLPNTNPFVLTMPAVSESGILECPKNISDSSESDWNNCLPEGLAEYETIKNESTNNTNISDGEDYGLQSSFSIVGRRYIIQTWNMGIGSSLHGGVWKIRLMTMTDDEGPNPIDNCENKVKGNEMEVRLLSRGREMSAKIITPEGIRLEDPKFERTVGALLVSVRIRTDPAAYGWHWRVPIILENIFLDMLGWMTEGWGMLAGDEQQRRLGLPHPINVSEMFYQKSVLIGVKRKIADMLFKRLSY